MAAALHDISVNIGPRRPAFVLDPALALSPLGLPLARRLCHGTELWLVRELWHILDDCDLLIGPFAVAPSAQCSGSGSICVTRSIARPNIFALTMETSLRSTHPTDNTLRSILCTSDF